MVIEWQLKPLINNLHHIKNTNNDTWPPVNRTLLYWSSELAQKKQTQVRSRGSEKREHRERTDDYQYFVVCSTPFPNVHDTGCCYVIEDRIQRDQSQTKRECVAESA